MPSAFRCLWVKPPYGHVKGEDKSVYVGGRKEVGKKTKTEEGMLTAETIRTPGKAFLL
jgi:hypothetical protein